MLSIIGFIGFTVITAIAIAAIGAAYHYKWEAQFNADLLDQATVQFLDSAADMVEVDKQLVLALQMAERDNAALSHDLQQYIAANLFDAWTIRNMTTSIVALSDQLDEYAVAHAKVVLGGKDVKK